MGNDSVSPSKVIAPDHAHPDRETIPCAFCHGQGVDPFAIMSDRSVCGACDGRGILRVVTPHMTCAYCRGTGSHKTYRCPICSGAGVVAAFSEPTRICADCLGRAYESNSGMPCLTCHGRGIVPESAS